MIPPSPPAPRGPLDWIPADAPAPVATARGLYHLRHWPAVVATLEAGGAGGARCGPDPGRALPGAATILALARARLGETEAALNAFAQAVAAEPEEQHARCAYAACLLRVGRAREAAVQLDAVAPPPRLRPVALSLRGAAHWQVGQRALGQAADREAAAQFERSARAFVAAAAAAATARQPLPERLAAAYVGQAVAMVAAEQFGAVPPLFARRRAQDMAVTPALTRFARELYEFCDLAARLEPSERRTAGAALRPVIARAAMSVNLWDGSQPVLLAWHGLVDK